MAELNYNQQYKIEKTSQGEPSRISVDSAWIPLTEYSVKKGISLSTLRRYIKAGKIQYRIEGGKYLLLDDESGGSIPMPLSTTAPQNLTKPTRSLQGHTASAQSLDSDRVRELTLALQKAQEEIAELKMLVAIYEEKITPSER